MYQYFLMIDLLKYDFTMKISNMTVRIKHKCTTWRNIYILLLHNFTVCFISLFFNLLFTIQTSSIIFYTGNGSLEFSEFLNLVKDIYQDPNKFETEIKEAFQRYDQDGNGVISQPEFKHLITSFDDKISDEEMKDLLSKVEMDKDGNINYDGMY